MHGLFQQAPTCDANQAVSRFRVTKEVAENLPSHFLLRLSGSRRQVEDNPHKLIAGNFDAIGSCRRSLHARRFTEGVKSFPQAGGICL